MIYPPEISAIIGQKKNHSNTNSPLFGRISSVKCKFSLR